MNVKKLTGIFPSLLRLALTICLVFNVIPAAGAQEKPQAVKPAKSSMPTASDKSVTPAEKPPSTDRSAEGPQEGIKVHGHWTIVLRNEDGSVASHHEFENSLTPNQGNLLLAMLLGRQAVMGQFTIFLVVSANNSGNQTSFGEPTLQVSVGAGTGTVVLSGTIKAPAARSITQVGSVVGHCVPTISAAQCSSSPNQAASALQFTSHDLASAIPVQNGQTTDVTVTLGFS